MNSISTLFARVQFHLSVMLFVNNAQAVQTISKTPETLLQRGLPVGIKESNMSQSTVETVIAQARAAQLQFETASQEVVDELIVGLAWAIIEPETNRSLAEQAVLETGLGNVEDKIM